MKKIPLTRGLHALVDDMDFARLTRYKWCANAGGYAVRNTTSREGAPRKQVLMHRELLQVPPKTMVDHINGNRLDNRRANLREADRSLNGLNRSGPQRNNRSGILGVYRSGRSWVAQLRVHTRNGYLGSFPTKEEAAKAVCAARKEAA